MFSDYMSADVLADGGDMGALMRSIDWSKTPLGPISGWSHALRTTVGLLLRNRFPMLLWWGPQFVQIYNDAYRPIPGAKHPRAMGQTGAECWAEIWHVLAPMVEAPFRGEPATSSDDLELFIEEDLSVDEIAARGFDRATVGRVLEMVKRNEYKRRQAPPGVRISDRAFGRDWRYPITSGYHTR